MKCIRCGQFRSRSNISRHQKTCGTPAKVNTASDDGHLSCSTPARGRSASKDSGVYGQGQQGASSLAYTPTNLSTMMTSVILEAVNALLDQHAAYTQQGLETYLAEHYPEIPEHFRAPVVIAATAGARQAALMHHVWEKNVSSLDDDKRQFAAGAASSLSFWALGMLPVHRSGSVYQPRGTPKLLPVAESRSQLVGTTPGTVLATPGPLLATSGPLLATPGTVLATHGPLLATPRPVVAAPRLVDMQELITGQDKMLALSDVIWPVPLPSQDPEFEGLLAAQASVSQTNHTSLFAAPTVTAAAQEPPSGPQKTKVDELQSEGGSPILVIHATSDIESDGDQARRTISAITVSSAGVKASAAATVKSCPATSGSTAPTRQGDRKRASPYHRRAGSPRRRRSWGRSDYSRRPSATYTVGAEEYRHFQDFMRQSRYKK